MWAAVGEPPPLRRQFPQSHPRRRIVPPPPAVAVRGAVRADDPTGPPLFSIFRCTRQTFPHPVNPPFTLRPYSAAVPTRCRIPLSAPSTPPGLTVRLLGIVAMLVERFLGHAPVALPQGELVEAIWRRVQRAFVRVQLLASTPPRAPSPTRRRSAPRPAAPPRDPDQDLSVVDIWRAQREHGWLLAMMPGLREVTDRLEHWLCDLALDDLLIADPRYIRAVRALGRMLGVNPDLLPPPYRGNPPEDPAPPDSTDLRPTDLRPVPRGYPRHWRVNQQGFAVLMAERDAAWGHADPPPALKPA